MQGAGETLRGTFNSSIDRHVGHASPERLAAHNQVLAAGRSEIETGKFYGSGGDDEKVKGKGKLGNILRKPVA